MKEKVFDDTANDVCFIPVHPTTVFDGFGSSVVKEDQAGSVTGSRVGREMT